MCVHLGIQHMVRERHSCPVPSVSVVAGSSRLSHRQTGGGRTTAPHKHNYTPRLRPVTQIQLHEPSQGPTIVPTHRGLARGQRVRRLSVDESVENEPGRSWSCATHTASVSVPRSRAENKSGPISSMWPAALPGSQPEKLLVRSLWSSQKVFGGTVLTRKFFLQKLFLTVALTGQIYCTLKKTAGKRKMLKKSNICCIWKEMQQKAHSFFLVPLCWCFLKLQCIWSLRTTVVSQFHIF